ncbi:MAG: hypothetical protein HY554_16030 [Elusimicrobia bacterium]|nr:hypothetical protein [Elusimicrobiota bacterium]
MRLHGPRYVPARYWFEAAESRLDGWGRFERLHALGGRLVTRFRLEAGDRVFLAFELRGETFSGLPARVERAQRDLDGYFLADLRLLDEVEARRLGRLIRGLAAAVPAERA